MEELPLTSSLRPLLEEVDGLLAARHVQFMRDLGACLRRHERALTAVASSADLLGATKPVLVQQQHPCVPAEAPLVGSDISRASEVPAHMGLDFTEIRSPPQSEAGNIVALCPPKIEMERIGEEAVTFSQEMRDLRDEALRKTSKNSDAGGSVDESLKASSAMSSVRSITAPRTVQQFIVSPTFDLVMSGIMITNIIFFGVQVEHMALTMQENPPMSIKVVSWGYTFLFMFELIVRMAADGIRNFFCSKSWGWNMVDLLAVLVSGTEALIEMIVGQRGANNYSQVRLLRMFRMARLLRIFRVVRYFRSLRILIHSVINTLKSLIWTFTLMAIILYSFGLLFTQHTTQARIEKPGEELDPKLLDFFGNLGNSIYTLFLCVTAGLEWNEPAEPLRRHSPVMMGFLLIFIAWNFFAVMNVITGVICQSAIEAAQSDSAMVISENMNRKNQYIHRLKELFHAIDTDRTQIITLDEFESCMQEKWFKAYFDSIDITVDQAFQLFKLLDTQHTGELDMDTFVTGCLRLRGNATTIDMALLLQESRWNMQKVMESERKSQAKLDLLVRRLWEERLEAERESQAKLDLLLQRHRDHGTGERAPAEPCAAQQGARRTLVSL